MRAEIAIVDYGMGNLRSVQKALERTGAVAVVIDDPAALGAAQGVVLPGVGAFGDAVANLRARRLIEPLLRQVSRGKPLLGICLGMQLLFDESEEMGHHRGLGLLPGRVVRFPEGDLGYHLNVSGNTTSRVHGSGTKSVATLSTARQAHEAWEPRLPCPHLKVPHVGWNQLQIADCRLQIARRGLLAGIADGVHAYFVHSYYVVPQDPADVLATTEYGIEFASVVGRRAIWGAQFHPEKSQEVGLRLLKNFSQAVSNGGIGNDCVSGD